jgi:hypothetical protein
MRPLWPDAKELPYANDAYVRHVDHDRGVKTLGLVVVEVKPGDVVLRFVRLRVRKSQRQLKTSKWLRLWSKTFFIDFFKEKMET